MQDPNLCDKQIHLTHSSIANVPFSYTSPTLQLTYPGNYTYDFSLTDYPDIVSDEFQFYVDPCSVTSFLNEFHNDDLDVNGL